MTRYYLGEFEEIVLLTVSILDGNAYAVSITHAIREETGRPVRLNQVFSALQRLEEKGAIKSRMGNATAERGGRRKRMFTISALGKKVLAEIQETRQRLWGLAEGKLGKLSSI